MKNNTNRMSAIVLVLATISFTLLSPKWLVPLAAWVAPGMLLFYVRRVSLLKGFLIGALVLTISGLIALFEVNPLPDSVFAIVTLIGSLISLLPYLADRLLAPRLKGFVSTLVFPCAGVTLELVNSFGAAGTWSSMANSQFTFLSLVQLASVTGIWGISFLVYWFASTVVWMAGQAFQWSHIRIGVMTYAGVFVAVILYGNLRITPLFNSPRETVRIAGVTVENLPFMRALYADHFGKTLHITNTTSQRSPQIQEMNKAFVPFIENPVADKFPRTFDSLKIIQDKLFSLSAQEAQAGAKIILWSEASAIVVKSQEKPLIERGRQFAVSNHIYLLMALAAILPGKVTAERRLMENKTVLFGPDGRILNIYFKNRPVPGVETSVPGDGNVPVIPTPYGRLSPVICYDADFNGLLRQTGRKGTDILLVPSGDWKAISPAHTHMAMMRGIENGCSVVRQVSGGLSASADYYGRVLASMDFFQTKERVNVAYVPTRKIATIYTYIGDVFAYFCALSLALLAGYTTAIQLKTRKLHQSATIA